MKQLRNIRKKGVEHMNDYEFRALLRLIVGPRAKRYPNMLNPPIQKEVIIQHPVGETIRLLIILMKKEFHV